MHACIHDHAHAHVHAQMLLGGSVRVCPRTDSRRGRGRVRVHAYDECPIAWKMKKDNFFPRLLLSVLSQPTTARYLLFFAIAARCVVYIFYPLSARWLGSPSISRTWLARGGASYIIYLPSPSFPSPPLHSLSLFNGSSGTAPGKIFKGQV
jgi:hypothetical protein